MTDGERVRAWRWHRVCGATPGEAHYLARAHPDVDPGVPTDLQVAADLLAQHREDNRSTP